MSKRPTKMTTAPRFGGDWTNAKLDVIAKYLSAYTTALREQPSKARPFVKGYIDAFAGSGYRDPRPSGDARGSTQPPLFPDLAEAEPQALLEGSARRALRTTPPFDRYVFIERNAERCAQLEGLKTDFPELAAAIKILNGDANAEIRKICATEWKSHRAVLFLDPFGLQVDWTTIEEIAKTQAIDLWLLFPLIGVTRLMVRSGEIPDAWRRRLDLLLGTNAWYDELYHVETTPGLFGDEDRLLKASAETIGRYFNERLRSVFADVAKEPKVLRNRRKNPLYLLCFAVGNRNGAPIALRIANHLLKGAE